MRYGRRARPPGGVNPRMTFTRLPMTSRPDQFLAWPGWASIAQFLLLAVPVTAWWVIVYHGADWLAGQRAHRGHVHLDAELAIPFVPAFILVYLSLDLVFLPAPFILRSRRELEALALSLAAITGVAGICFVVF